MNLKFTNSVTAGLFILATLSDSLAQGSILFANHRIGAGVDAPVFDSSGSRLEGPRYRAALYAGLAQSSLQFRADTPLLMGPQSGYFDGGIVIANDFQPTFALWVQVTAWDTTVGTTFEAVKSLGVGGYGESALFQV